mmetsp:Transcript_96818/g.255707  ORF Transcript_96818/g.255707 Transcript_96818/m.255707 type:complete len:238 (+) Transcript_96818:1184-1897(+)
MCSYSAAIRACEKRQARLEPNSPSPSHNSACEKSEAKGEPPDFSAALEVKRSMAMWRARAQISTKWLCEKGELGGTCEKREAKLESATPTPPSASSGSRRCRGTKREGRRRSSPTSSATRPDRRRLSPTRSPTQTPTPKRKAKVEPDAFSYNAGIEGNVREVGRRSWSPTPSAWNHCASSVRKAGGNAGQRATQEEGEGRARRHQLHSTRREPDVRRLSKVEPDAISCIRRELESWR